MTDQVLSSAIILENNVPPVAEIPWQTTLHLSPSSALCSGESHYFRQILNMTTFISVKPTGKGLAIGQPSKSFATVLNPPSRNFTNPYLNILFNLILFLVLFSFLSSLVSLLVQLFRKFSNFLIVIISRAIGTLLL